MIDPRLNKSEELLFVELIEKIQLLDDAVNFVKMGKKYYVQVIAVCLRSLMCDKDCNEGGLLFYFSRKFDFKECVRRDEDDISLENYKNLETLKKMSGDEITLRETRGNIIKKIAEEGGLAHSALKVRPGYALFYTVLNMGHTEKIDPFVMTILKWGTEILDYSNRLRIFLIKNKTEEIFNRFLVSQE